MNIYELDLEYETYDDDMVKCPLCEGSHGYTSECQRSD